MCDYGQIGGQCPLDIFDPDEYVNDILLFLIYSILHV